MDELLQKQEIYWAQRSIISWLKHGDKNTKFFHSKATQRRRKNHIRGAGDQMKECLDAVPSRVTEDMLVVLSSEFTAEEIKVALFQMGPTKAPRPDGMNAFFYQKFWHIVGDDVVFAVLDFLNNGNMLPEINHTNIVLIPKVKDPEKMSDFRPISLCNIIYKIISKVLANRLKQVLPHIISPTQSAIVLGRLITDNVLVAYETLHLMHARQKGKKGSLALKLDISKAYDRVEWQFLQKIMEKMGFLAVWIERVMSCVTTSSFSILVNCKPYGMVHPSRGIRQGDPLSPYLFLLCAEGFTTLLDKAELEGRISGVSICRGAPRASNLLFADDSLLFCQATQNEGEAIMEIIQTYANASGQSINLEKSSVYFSANTTGVQWQQMLQILGVKEVMKFDSYLGLPTLIGRAKYHTFSYLKDRVWKNLQGWKGMMLARAGKEILIKAVAQSIPTYTMSVFQLPMKLCDELDNLCAKFWWGQVGNERKIHWRNWDKLSTSKQEGGIGFRNLRDFNLAMYYPRSSFIEAKESPGCSYVWRSLVAALPILKSGYCWGVGNGSSISVMGDKWIPNYPTNKVLHPIHELVDEMAVSELIDPELHVWRGELIMNLFHRDDATAITKIPLSRRVVSDSIIWMHNKNGMFSVKSAYKVAQRMRGEGSRAEHSGGCVGKLVWSVLWKLCIPNKIKIFGWRACNDILPTKCNLVKRNIITDDKCHICTREAELVFHALWGCVAVQDVWAGRISKLQKGVSDFSDFMQLMEHLVGRLSVEELKHPTSLNKRAEEFLEEFKQAQVSLDSSLRERLISDVWQPPSSMEYKLNFDAAIFSRLEKSSIGAIIRNDKGEVMAGMFTIGPKVDTSEEAELLACRRSIEFAVDAGFTRLVIEGDNSNVMQAISSNVAN
ncbi:hypothetical protein SO802_013621 [Lithocarpus litseifolius]|uniref:Reverse transcriptase domain-containing protein n=1 Tax=Lithocarpus litseifolius TaxID=425828 RepID=A0AAW2D646_9ROSI